MNTPAAITAERVSKALGGRTILDEVSLDVPPARIHALVGLNGAGKTTLMRILLGMLSPDRGSAHLAGTPVRGRHSGHGSVRCWRPRSPTRN